MTDIELDQSIEDLKSAVRNADDPDYNKLLEEEENGKQRKTMIKWFQQQIRNKSNSIWKDCPYCGQVKIKKYKSGCKSCTSQVSTAKITR